jgi:hypothetical protein
MVRVESTEGSEIEGSSRTHISNAGHPRADLDLLICFQSTPLPYSVINLVHILLPVLWFVYGGGANITMNKLRHTIITNVSVGTEKYNDSIHS